MKLNLNKKKKVTRKLGEQSFSVVPYISLSQKEFILDKLIEFYNDSKTNNETKYLLELRANLDILVISATTDIELDESDYEDLVSSGLINLIRKTVINYDEIYQDALFMIQATRFADLMKNLESDNDIFNDLPKFLDNLSPEQIDRLNMVGKITEKDAVLKAVRGGE